MLPLLFCNLTLFFMTLAPGKITGHLVCRMPLRVNLSGVFLMSRLRWWVWDRSRRWSALLILTLSGIHSINTTYLNLDHLVKVVWCGFSTPKLLVSLYYTLIESKVIGLAHKRDGSSKLHFVNSRVSTHIIQNSSLTAAHFPQFILHSL